MENTEPSINTNIISEISRIATNSDKILHAILTHVSRNLLQMVTCIITS